MSVSLRTIEPFSGLSSPTRDFRNTDLPVPDGPSRTEISPGGNVSVTSLQMFWLPKDFDSSLTSTATPTCPRPPFRLRCQSPPRRVRRAPESSCVQPFRASGRRRPQLLISNDRGRARLRAFRGCCDRGLRPLHEGAPRFT